MTQASLKVRGFAKRLIDCEKDATKTYDTKVPVAFQVCEKLRPLLATLLGNDGFRALLSRSLALAIAEEPRLSVAHVNSNGSLEGLDKLEGELSEASVLLVGHLLGLLVVFIGESLTIRLVSEVWPKLLLKNLDFDEKVAHE